MKKIVISFLIIITLLATALPVFAAEDYTSGIKRVNDFADYFTDEDQDTLNTRAWGLLHKYKIDVVIVVVSQNSLENIADYARQFYNHNVFGYYESRDGIILGVDTYYNKYSIKTFGRGEEIFTQEITDEIGAKFVEMWSDKYPALDIFSVYLDGIEDTLSKTDVPIPETTVEETDTATETTTKPENTTAKTESTTTTEKEFPDWFPDDPASVTTRFHGENLPCLVDDADIFTDEEESEIVEAVEKVKENSGSDFVIYTDNSSYGYSRGVWAANFFEFNGYGTGDNYSGLVLFICMQSGNRGWWTAGTGDIEYLFTENNINRIDDVLEPYMIDGDYAEGMLAYTEQIDSLLGSEKKPDWYPEKPETFCSFNGKNLPYIVDNANLFSDEEETVYLEKINSIISTYGKDVLIYTDTTDYWKGADNWAKEYYVYNGYGIGEQNEGICLFIFKNGNNIEYGYGSNEKSEYDYLQDSSITDILYEHSENQTNAQSAVTSFLDDAVTLYEKGRFPRTLYDYIMAAILSILPALIVLVIVFKILDKGMQDAPKLASNANRYIVKGSVNIVRTDVKVIGVNVTRKYDPPSSSSSSSSSSGRSSYSGGYHSSSSSGSSYSGGGRSF